MDVDTARKFGQMESRMDNIEARSIRIEDKLDKLVSAVAEAGGGRKMLLTLLTLSAALGGLLTKLGETFLR